MAKEDNLRKMSKGETLNPNGRPKKVQNVIRNLYLDDEGIKLTDSQIKEILRGYLSKTKDEIDIIMKDPQTPMAIKMGFQLMGAQSKKGNAELFKWLFEMQVGKPKGNDKIDVTTNGESIKETKTGLSIDDLISAINGTSKE